jgi:hypothetical protein
VRDRVGDESFKPVGGDFVEGFIEVPIDVERRRDRAVTRWMSGIDTLRSRPTSTRLWRTVFFASSPLRA